MTGVRHPVALAVILIALALAGGRVDGADRQMASCKAIDDAGGSNQLVIELREGRVHTFRYRRSVGAPRCEIEASRSPSAYSWERSEWIDGAGVSEVFLYSDDDEDAHVRLRRQGPQIELRVIAYDRWWHCGSGQYLNPAIAVRLGEDLCLLDP